MTADASRRIRRTGLSWPAAKEYATGVLFLSPSLVLFAVFILWPIVETVWLSLHANNIIGQATLFVGFRQYATYFQQSGTWQILGNTLYFAAATVIPTIVLALGISAVLAQKLRAIGIFRTLLATPFAFSSATAAVVFATFFSPVGTFNGFLQQLHLRPVNWLTSPNLAMPSVAAMSVWLLLGYDVLVLTAGFGGIPEDILEASSLDGARGWTLFRRVLFPLLSPTVFFLLVVNTITALQSFGQIDIMTQGGPANSTTTLVYSIYLNAFGFGSANFGLASAEAIVLFVLVLIVTGLQFGVLQRRVFYQ